MGCLLLSKPPSVFGSTKHSRCRRLEDKSCLFVTLLACMRPEKLKHLALEEKIKGPALPMRPTAHDSDDELTRSRPSAECRAEIVLLEVRQHDPQHDI